MCGLALIGGQGWGAGAGTAGAFTAGRLVRPAVLEPRVPMVA